jgi:hypothetical protein
MIVHVQAPILGVNVVARRILLGTTGSETYAPVLPAEVMAEVDAAYRSGCRVAVVTIEIRREEL